MLRLAKLSAPHAAWNHKPALLLLALASVTQGSQQCTDSERLQALEFSSRRILLRSIKREAMLAIGTVAGLSKVRLPPASLHPARRP